MANIRGNRVVSGSMGQLWFNGNLLAEVKSVESKATINRDTVQMAGSYDEDSKTTSVACEGSFVVHKVFSREAEFVKGFQDSEDARFQLFVTLDDKDAYGRESVQLDNCWFNELTIAQFEAGSILEREFPFGHTFSDIKYPETIPTI